MYHYVEADKVWIHNSEFISVVRFNARGAYANYRINELNTADICHSSRGEARYSRAERVRTDGITSG